MHSFVALVAAATCSSPCDDVVFSKRVTSLYNDYRLGDILGGYAAPGKSWENQTKTWYVCKKWPLSLACRYRQATRNHHDVAVLSSLLPAPAALGVGKFRVMVSTETCKQVQVACTRFRGITTRKLCSNCRNGQ